MNFVSDEEGKIQVILESPEDIERELGINRNDYKTRQQKIDLIGQFAFRWNNYVYSKTALSEFFNLSKYGTTRLVASTGVADKIQWEK